MKKTVYIIFFCLLMIFAGATGACAHMMWLLPDDYTPSAGQEVNITLGFGHQFPKEVMERDGMVERVYAITPDGRVMEAEKKNTHTYVLTPETGGTYVLYAALNPGFMSTTTDGRKRGNRKTLDNVVSCFAFNFAAMTTIACEGKPFVLNEKKQLDLEIIPQQDPHQVNAGDTLAVKVVFENKPLAGASLSAVYAQSENNKPHTWDQETTTDKDGIARIKITTPGKWLFNAGHKFSYPDPEICDVMRYATTLTIEF